MSTINNLTPEPPKPHNAHRDGGYRDLQDWEDSELGKGPGDPDISNPPYEKPAAGPKVSSGGLEGSL